MAHQRRRRLDTETSGLLDSLEGLLGPPHSAGPENLAIFANTQFFDLDLGQQTDFRASDGSHHRRNTTAVDDLASFSEYLSGAATATADNLIFDDFSQYPDPTTMGVAAAAAGGGGAFADHLPVTPDEDDEPQTPHLPSLRGPPPRDGDKSTTTTPETTARHHHRRGLTADEIARLAAEEDKRRRNTAASARFRVKKKQREQALEKSTKEMADKIGHLQGRIQHLEMENKWLKNLVIEKNKARDGKDASVEEPESSGAESAGEPAARESEKKSARRGS